MTGKHLIYKSEFENVDEGSISSNISTFTAALAKVKYETISTGAAYDSAFNTAIGKLQAEVAAMKSLCSSCLTVVTMISDYKGKYTGYKAVYDAYETAYSDYESDYANWEKQNTIKKWFGSAPAAPDTGTLLTLEDELKQLAQKIKNYSLQ